MVTCQVPIRRHPTHARPHGLTLVELLVVVAIIGLLLSLTLPAVQAARESANKSSCANNLHQLGLAVEQHHNQYCEYPMSGKHDYGILVYLLPFVEEKDLYYAINPGRPTGGGSDDSIKTAIKVYLCPSSGGDLQVGSNGQGRTSFLGTSDLFDRKRPAVSEDIVDGKSKTLLIGETLAPLAWSTAKTGANSSPPNAGGDFSSRHSGGAQFALCDGSVQFIRDDIEPSTFKALCTIDGKEATNEF
jgi:prepilin-type N-terminal cleavage/methylation domain-containing protein/prepilin-type processing-associated H-X9-DG protein